MALCLGRTVRELESELSAKEFMEWLEYDRLEPFGTVRDNWHAAVIASMSLAPHTKDGKAPSLSQFFYVDPETAREKRDRAMINWLNSRSLEK